MCWFLVVGLMGSCICVGFFVKNVEIRCFLQRKKKSSIKEERKKYIKKESV